MIRGLFPGAAALLVVFRLASQPLGAAERNVTVRFAKGATSANLNGALRGWDGMNYRVATVAGQTMQVLFAPSNRSCYFNVFEPGVAEAVHIGSTKGNEFGRNPTTAGSYRIQIYLMRNAARRNETCRYRLSIEITGTPGGVIAGVADTVMRDICKGTAAPMYGVQPRDVTLSAGILAADRGGFTIDGTIDKGREGVKKMRCIFTPDRKLDRVMAMTPDGEVGGRGRRATSHTSSKSSLANSARSWMKSKRASALLPISRSTDFCGRLVVGFVLDQHDLQQRALPRVHGGFLELRRHHLAEALEAADLDLGVGAEFLLEDFVLVLVVARIERLAAMGEPVERRHREIEMAVLDQLRHLAVEERDQQRGDVGAVDVGVGHDDDLVVAQILVAVVRAGAAAERLDQVGELLVLRELVLAGGLRR